MLARLSLPYQQGRNLLLLEELLDELRLHGVSGELLLRASPGSELERLLTYGTTRGGFTSPEPWRDGRLPDREILHEDVIFGTSPEEIRQGEGDPACSTSFKKLPGMTQPMLQIYQRSAFERIADRQHLFRNPARKIDALRAVCLLDQQPAIDGWFSEAAGLQLRELASRVSNGTIVEVGCWKGLSASYIARLATRRGTRLVCIDGWCGSTDAFDAQYRRLLAMEDVAATFAQNLERLGLKAEVRRAQSPDAARDFADSTLDLVFLDASHDAEAVAADLRAWAPKLKPDGVLAGHDFSPRHPGVAAAVNEFAHESGRRYAVDPSSIWCLGTSA